MLSDFSSTVEYLNYLLAIANAPEYTAASSIITFLSILLISGTISQIFMRYIKSRYLGFLVSSICSIWLYEQIYVKGLSLLEFLISIILLFAFLGILILIILTLFVKKVSIPLKTIK